MSWWRKPKYTVVRAKSKKVDIPDGLWRKCEGCGEIIYNKELETNLKVCPKCNYHFRLTAQERIVLLLDDRSFQEHSLKFDSADPLKFPEYEEKLKTHQERTGLKDALIVGEGKINHHWVALGVTDFYFMGGSMGSVLGETVTQLIEYATQRRGPLIIVSGSGGGARMQEGMISLMQMAKTAAALARFHQLGLLYISVLTDSTGGGVAASFGMLGDFIIAEPKALICFAGPRVIEQTIRQKLPEGFQKAEFLVEHGIIDMVVERKELKNTLAKILDFFSPPVSDVKNI